MTDLDRDLKGLLLLLDTGKHDHVHIDRKFAVKAAAAVRGLRDRPCPHIETGDDGTAFCALAESANTAWAARWQQQHDRAERAERALRACWEQYEELMPEQLYDQIRETLGLRVFTAAVPDRPGGTDNPTSDCPNCGASDCQDSCAEERFLQALKLAGDQPGENDGR